MKFSEKLKILKANLKSHFVSDQVKKVVLFIDDFFPSKMLFELSGFPILNHTKNVSNSKLQNLKKKIFIFSATIIMIFAILLVINFLLTVGKREKLLEAAESIGFAGGLIFNFLRVFLLCYWKRETITKLINRLDQNFPHTYREQLLFDLQKHQKILKNLSRFSICIFIIVWFNYASLSFFTFCSGFFGFKSTKVSLLLPIYFPVDPYQPLLYPAFFVAQAWSFLILVLICAATDLIFCGLICLTSMEFDFQAQNLSRIDPESDENAVMKLREIIDAYNELTDIGNEIENIFSPILLINTPLDIILIAKFFLTLPALFIQFFSISYYGEQLQISSMRVADEAYNCNWYGKNLKFRKMILLTVLRAQQPQKLTGMKFMDIGLPVFYWSIRTAHSYYSLLSGVYSS